jgi:hypothetical protein
MAELVSMSELAAMPWSRLREESELDFRHFELWLQLSPRPVALDPALAVRHNWAERATAWDSYQSLAGLSPKQTAEQVFKMWAVVILNETKKWTAKSLRENSEPSLLPAAIEGFIDLVTDPARNQAGRPSHDFSGLAPERRALLLELLEEAKVNE